MFGPTSNQKATYEPRYDANGKIWRQAIAHGALTKNTPYVLTSDQYGPVTEANTAGNTYHRVIVPNKTIASDALFWGQTGGYIPVMETPALNINSNDGFDIYSDAITDAGAFAEQANVFAICQDDDNNSNHAAMLLDREILSSNA